MQIQHLLQLLKDFIYSRNRTSAIIYFRIASYTTYWGWRFCKFFFSMIDFVAKSFVLKSASDDVISYISIDFELWLFHSIVLKNKQSIKNRKQRKSLWCPFGYFADKTTYSRHLSRTIWAEISAKLSWWVCVSFQSQKVKEHWEKIHAHCPAGR